MNFVRNLILTLVVGGVVSLAATTAQAVDFNFWVFGYIGGVYGVITLSKIAVGSRLHKATSIKIDEYYDIRDGKIYGPINHHINFSDMSTRDLLRNEFTVNAGLISEYHLQFFDAKFPINVYWGNDESPSPDTRNATLFLDKPISFGDLTFVPSCAFTSWW